MKEQFAHFHLIRLETLLSKSGFVQITLDDDGEQDFWLDVTTENYLATIHCQDGGYRVQVQNLQGEDLRQAEGLSLDAVLPFLSIAEN